MTEFISRNHHDSYEVIIKTDCHKHWEESVKFARKLIGHAKPMTNGDRIRAMTDEDLATLVPCPSTGDCGNNDRRDCKKGCLNWLQQPVKEDAE